MAQQKNSNKSSQTGTKKPQSSNSKKNNDDPKTFGKEPPIKEPQTPEQPDQYEVSGDEPSPDQGAKPTLH